jgi:hypothetical protein
MSTNRFAIAAAASQNMYTQLHKPFVYKQSHLVGEMAWFRSPKEEKG